MANTLDQYDKEKLIKARTIIDEVYQYNYNGDWDPLTKKLNTVLNKIDKLIEEAK